MNVCLMSLDCRPSLGSGLRIFAEDLACGQCYVALPYRSGQQGTGP